eukprot:15480227-Alexandrium_andersonii.AAC.1
MLFLDWAKAFDRLHPEGVSWALLALGVPAGAVEVVAKLIADPLFYPTICSKASEWKGQRLGVRQGCTLSPLLFICVLTVVVKTAAQKT